MIRGSILLVLFLSITVLSGYRYAPETSHYQTNELLVSISLDSIPPGSITRKQVASLQKLIISSGGRAYGAKSFTFAIAPKEGPAYFSPGFGNTIPAGASYSLSKVKPGDFIIVANIVLFNNIKYKAVLDPTWTVVADTK